MLGFLGRLVNVATVRKNLYDFLLGEYAWIQQESVFFTRGLWQQAGGKINEKYRLMVDGELWCRFFRHAPLWQAKVVLSGYRIHHQNRAALYIRDVHREMDMAIGHLRTELPADVLKTAKRLQRLRRIKNWPLKLRIPLATQDIAKKIFRNTLRKAQYRELTFSFRSQKWETRLLDWQI